MLQDTSTAHLLYKGDLGPHFTVANSGWFGAETAGAMGWLWAYPSIQTLQDQSLRMSVLDWDSKYHYQLISYL